MQLVNEQYDYKQISASANIRTGSGGLGFVFVSAASSTPTITVYDSATTTTGTKIVDTFTPVAANTYVFPFSFYSGCYVVISGTVSCTFGTVKTS